MSKSTKLGCGGRFAKLKAHLMSEGKSEESAQKIAATAGAHKYGKSRMAKWAAKGRKRS